jgi:hypothetical protein
MKILADMAVNTTNNITITQSNIDMKGYIGFFKLLLHASIHVLDHLQAINI